ncbi:MAG: hypothetical protein R3E58_19435 [Phycisphaerae bacterium]
MTLLLGVVRVCTFDKPGTVTQLQQEIDQQGLAARRRASRQSLNAALARCEELKTQIDNQPRLASVELDDLFVVDAIKIPSRSGRIDLDKHFRDDGVIVYVQPVDAAGDVIKAARGDHHSADGSDAGGFAGLSPQSSTPVRTSSRRVGTADS